ncbi:MAG TPA: methyltransferase [Gemmatimonadaceae bacterium]
MTCCQSCIASKQFDKRVAERELRRYRRRGPDAATQVLIDALQARKLPPTPTLMDVGGGVGTIHHVLLERGFSHATHFDASDAYLAVAAAEAERLGHNSRVGFEAGDFSSASSLPMVDVVTLHRVVCCDRNGPDLLRIAAAHARHLVAFSYPRRRWITRVVAAGINAFKRLTGDPFRVFLHEPSTMAAALEREGMRPAWSGGTFVWSVEIFERAA